MQIPMEQVQCRTCRHYLEGEGASPCPGFPDGPIPEEILRGEWDHRKPFPGDHGYRYERNPFLPPEQEEEENEKV